MAEEWREKETYHSRLNTQIAELLGCNVIDKGIVPQCGCDRPWPHGEGHKEFCAELKDYSRSMKHAWDVVESMQDKGYALLSETEDGKRKISFIKEKTYWTATAPEIPEAICKAALLTQNT